MRLRDVPHQPTLSYSAAFVQRLRYAGNAQHPLPTISGFSLAFAGSQSGAEAATTAENKQKVMKNRDSQSIIHITTKQISKTVY